MSSSSLNSLLIFSSIRFHFRDQLKWLLVLLTGLMIAIALAVGFKNGTYHYYGTSGLAMKHNVAQFTPVAVRQMFTSSDFDALTNRVWALEKEMLLVRQRPQLTDKAVKQLEEDLPFLLTARRDRLHRIVLTSALWEAIRRRISNDPHLAFFAYSGQDFNDPSIPHKQLDAAVAASAHDFFKREHVKTTMIDGRFADLLDTARTNDVVISRAEAIELIKDNFNEHAQSVKKTIEQMELNFNMMASKMAATDNAVKYEDIVEQVMAKVQIAALANANIKANIASINTKLNHFAPNAGAIINIEHLTPTYEHKAILNMTTTHKILRWLAGRSPHTPQSPSEALKKWEEHGDCWCGSREYTAPYGKNEGAGIINPLGVSLPIMTGNHVFPEEVVVEHITPTASFSPGAVPKDMELLAFIPDIAILASARELSNTLFPAHHTFDEDMAAGGWQSLPDGYLRIAAWQYDAERGETVQAFDVPLDLKMLGVRTHQFIVRARNNWGADVPYTCFYRVRLHGEYVKE